MEWKQLREGFLRPIKPNKSTVSTYLDLFEELEEGYHAWKHFICKIDLFPYFLEMEDFLFSEVSCICECSSLDKTHVHAFAAYKKSPDTLRRRLTPIYAKLGIDVKQGSNFNYKFINLKGIQHFLATFVYVQRKILHRKKSTEDFKIKHSDFTPFGDTRFSNSNPTPKYMKNLWDDIYSELIKRGRLEDVKKCKEDYQQYKNKQSTERLKRIQYGTQRKQTSTGIDDLDNISLAFTLRKRSGEIRERIGNEKCKCGLPAPADPTQDHYPDHSYINVYGHGIPACKVYQKDTEGIMDNVSGNARDKLIQKMQSSPRWQEQYRKIVSRAILDAESLDNGNDRQNGHE